MDRVALDLGFIQIYWYSIFIFLAMVVACFLIYQEAKKRKIDEEFMTNLIFNTIIVSIVGARVYYVIFNLGYYLGNPVEIFEIWNGGLAIHGGIIAATLFMMWYCKKHNVEFLKIADIAVVGLIIGQAIGRWGNFFNSEAYGQITTYKTLIESGIPKFVVDGMYILGEYRQPTFFYESVWCFFGFLAMLIVRKISKYLKTGQLTGFYLIWYGIARFLIEGLRTDSLMLGPIKMAQVVSIGFIILGIYLFTKNRKNNDESVFYRYVPPKEQEAVVYFK
ncbi:MAG: prolipoprotein diacylglyceryl transferase [Bacilli bacterium]|nr:prolipoprotein diacylglyceryl transferase [Bacilli bacterium]